MKISVTTLKVVKFQAWRWDVVYHRRLDQQQEGSICQQTSSLLLQHYGVLRLLMESHGKKQHYRAILHCRRYNLWGPLLLTTKLDYHNWYYCVILFLLRAIKIKSHEYSHLFHIELKNWQIHYWLNDTTTRKCEYRRGLDWWMDLLTTYTHDSELETITVPLLISTFPKSPQHPLSLFFPICCIFISCSLATASNSWDSSALRAQVLS
jgi:hypothetical protein